MSETPKNGPWIIAVLAVGLVVRLVLAAVFKGHPIDIGTFSAWAGHAADGLLSFYSPGYFADYPPGYIYVLWVIGTLRAALDLGYDTPAFLVLLKLPAILADLMAAWLIYRFAQRRWSGPVPLVLAAIYVLNPAVILDSAVWGQVDGVLTLFVLIGLTLLLESKPAASGAAFAAALLVKPQMLIFAPVPLLWFAAKLIGRNNEGDSMSGLFGFAVAATLVFALGVLPFAGLEGAAWVIEKYSATMASYPYASLNAFNLFALVGGNGIETGQKFLFLPFATWGAIFILAIVAFSALVAWRGQELSRFAYLALFLPASVFVLSTKMHERYLFPALAMALLFYIVSRDRRALWLFCGLSTTLFINVAQVLALSVQDVYLVPRSDPLMLAVSAANLALWLLLAWTGCQRYVFRAP